MTTSQHGPLRLDRRGRVVDVTIDAPPLQLVDGAFIGGLFGLLAELEHDAEVAVVVFRSADPDFFLMHGDVELIVGLGGPAVESPTPNVAAAVFERIRRAPWLSVGVLDGAARGGGCEFLSALDIRIGTDRSVIGQPEAVLGIIPGAGGTVRWPRIIGRGSALEFLLTGRDMTADEALACGWLQVLTSPGMLELAVGRLVGRVARLAPAVVAELKRVVDLSLGELDTALTAETNANSRLHEAGTHTAPMRRFLDAGGQTRAGELTRLQEILDTALG